MITENNFSIHTSNSIDYPGCILVVAITNLEFDGPKTYSFTKLFEPTINMSAEEVFKNSKIDFIREALAEFHKLIESKHSLLTKS